jgi:hypothetical protein
MSSLPTLSIITAHSIAPKILSLVTTNIITAHPKYHYCLLQIPLLLTPNITTAHSEYHHCSTQNIITSHSKYHHIISLAKSSLLTPKNMSIGMFSKPVKKVEKSHTKSFFSKMLGKYEDFLTFIKYDDVFTFLMFFEVYS